MSAQRDPELDQLADERQWSGDDRELAQYLRAAPHLYASVEPSPAFRQQLQRRLMREAWELASQPPPPWYRRVLAGPSMAWAGAAIGGVLIVFVAFFYLASPRQTDRIDVRVASPQQNAQLVSTVQPIELQFSQPMDTSSVKVKVEPTTSIKTEWQGNTLKITPVNGLSANTQYQVKVTAAQTAAHQAVSRIDPVTFTTGPRPVPTPSAGPTPSPSTSPVLTPRAIAPIGTPPARWMPDGSGLLVIGPNGQLQLFPLAGGTAQKLADAVSQVAVSPDGSPAWISGSQVTWKTTVISGVQAIALGFRSGSSPLLIATPADVQNADQKRVAVFKETADAADFSPSGDRVVYHGASGIHVVDLAQGRDTLLGPAAGLGRWSTDGRHYAYATDSGVSVADAGAATASPFVDLPGVTGLSWSPGSQLLLSTSGSLYLATYTDAGRATPHRLQDAVFAQPDWAPSGAPGTFSFRRGGEVWVARVQGALAGGPITPVTPGITQEDLVNAFMTARKNQLGDQALGFLDAAGRDAFARVNLLYTDPALSRYYVILSQPGRVVVRLVLVHGTVQTAVDETLTVQTDASGHPLIHGVSEVPRSPFATGPEVVSVSVASGQVQVVFDSDLDSNSTVQPGAITIKGVPSQARFDSKQRTVTLTVPGGLTPGTTYDLVIDPSLQDVNQRHATAYDLQFNGPSAG
jgi:Bacterial Ig-like domain